MPSKKIKCLYEDLCQFVVNKRSEVISGNELWSLYNKYVEYQNSITERENNNGDRKILYFLLEKLYTANCEDEDLISAVIKRFHMEQIWFHGIISDCFKRSKHFDTDEIIELLEFCFKYAYKKRILFDGMRLAILSHFFELLFPDFYYTPYLPKIMGIFLRYGMLLNPIDGHAPSLGFDYFRSNSENLSYTAKTFNLNWGSLWHSIISEGIILHNPKFLPLNELPDKQKQIVNICMEVANMFMRESMQFKLTDFYFSVAKQEFFEANPVNLNRREMLYFVLNRMSTISQTDPLGFIQKLGRFIPELPRRCFEPISLKCSCKQNIRKLLHLNWQIPFGIFKLDMPKSLTQYLNLEIN